MPIHLCIALGCLVLQLQSRAAVTETMVGLKSLKYLLFGSLWKKFVNPRSIHTDIHFCPVTCSSEVGHTGDQGQMSQRVGEACQEQPKRALKGTPARVVGCLQPTFFFALL